VTGRDSSANGRPHLGLGLYIVRLIVDFHRGSVSAANLKDGSGIVVSVELPKL
jgi:two-component system, OmpR family, sensor histidine kinase ChvG